ncbi:MAG: TolC family protein [Candidatus Omnitrophica bacterium]|nr:TolC family protein [Candidatus Omnitrophota bacterium]
MKLKKIFILLFILIITSGIVFAQEVSYLDDLVQEALDNNPNLKSLEKRWQAKKARILSEKTLPQPEFGFGYYGESIQTKVGPMEKKFSVKQPIPFPTKLSTRGKIAKKEAEIYYAKYILAVRGVIEQLKLQFYDYYFVQQSRLILKAEKLILEGVRETIKSKYETLNAPQQDLVKIDVEIAKIEDRILQLKRQENLLRAQINKTLNRSQKKELNLPLGYELKVKELLVSKKELLEKAYQASPHLLVDILKRAKQEEKFSLAKQGYLPDFSIMADYIEIGDETTNLAKDGRDAWMVGVGIKIPLWFWKINSEVKSEKLNLEAEKYQVLDKENFLEFKIEDLWFKLKTEEQLIDLYENVIVPESQHNFSVSRTGYESRALDFLSFLDAERNLISIKIAALKQRVDYLNTIAQLEYIIGEDLGG